MPGGELSREAFDIFLKANDDKWGMFLQGQAALQASIGTLTCKVDEIKDQLAKYVTWSVYDAHKAEEKERCRECHKGIMTTISNIKGLPRWVPWVTAVLGAIIGGGIIAIFQHWLGG